MNKPINSELAILLFKKHGVLFQNISDVIEDLSLIYLEETNEKIQDLEIFNSLLFQHFLKTYNFENIN